MSDLLKVTEAIRGASSKLPEYPLLPGDVVKRSSDGTYTKLAPGLGVGGFVLTDDQVATLEPTDGTVVIL